MDEENVTQIAAAQVERGQPPPVVKQEATTCRLRPAFNIRVSVGGESLMRGGAAQQSTKKIQDYAKAAPVPNECSRGTFINRSADLTSMGGSNKNGELEENSNNTIPCIESIEGSSSEFESSVGPNSTKSWERATAKKNISPYNIYMSMVRTQMGVCGNTPSVLQKMMDDLPFEDIHRRALVLVWESKDECKRRREKEKKSMSSKGRRCRLVNFSLLCKDMWGALSPDKKGEYRDALDLANLPPLQRRRLRECV